LQLPQLVKLGATQLVLDDGERMDAPTFIGLLKQDEWVDAYTRRVVRHYVHPVGTARMGAVNDELAVVDQHGRVHGTSHLRVADASIMPTVPSANTNLPCIMIGERVAAWLCQESN
jgi:choline dehydrogenase-like flavoprotein